MREQRQARHWIDGEWIGSPTIRDSENPATGEVIGTFSDGGAEAAAASIDAAARCFDISAWRLDPMNRAAALSHLADAYQDRLEDVIDTLCLENSCRQGGNTTRRPARGRRVADSGERGSAFSGGHADREPSPGTSLPRPPR